MMFQVSNAKGRQFLDLFDNNFYPIESLYTKKSSWIKYFRHLNLLCTRATRAIINHASIGEYCLYFFPNENFSCLCENYLIKSRHYILYNCRRFNNYWNLRQDTIGHFVSFLEFNKNVLSFQESITQQYSICLYNSNYIYFILFFFYMFFAPI